MTAKERKLLEDLWAQFRACLVHATATPSHIAKWQQRVDEVLDKK